MVLNRLKSVNLRFWVISCILVQFLKVIFIFNRGLAKKNYSEFGMPEKNTD